MHRYGMAPSAQPRLRIVDRKGGDVDDAELGDHLTVRIEFSEPTDVYALFAKDLVVRDSSGQYNMTLLDTHGCPTDTSMMRAVNNVPDENALEAVFEVFAFPNDEMIIIEVLCA